jgi:hypothetical protein
MRRAHAPSEKAERRRIYVVGVIVAAAMIAPFARAFMPPSSRF